MQILNALHRRRVGGLCGADLGVDRIDAGAAVAVGLTVIAQLHDQIDQALLFAFQRLNRLCLRALIGLGQTDLVAQIGQLAQRTRSLA